MPNASIAKPSRYLIGGKQRHSNKTQVLKFTIPKNIAYSAKVRKNDKSTSLSSLFFVVPCGHARDGPWADVPFGVRVDTGGTPQLVL